MTRFNKFESFYGNCSKHTHTLAALLTMSTVQRTCSICHQPGHNKRTCPQRVLENVTTTPVPTAAPISTKVPAAVKTIEKPTTIVKAPAKPTVERQIDRLCWNYNIPVEVQRLIKVMLQRIKMADCMAQAFDPIWLRAVCSISPTYQPKLKRYRLPIDTSTNNYGFATPGRELIQVNYGRLLIHLMHPQCYNKRFRLLDHRFARKQVVV